MYFGVPISLTGFPDVEGIETPGVPARRIPGCLTGFPDVEGIETRTGRAGPGSGV